MYKSGVETKPIYTKILVARRASVSPSVLSKFMATTFGVAVIQNSPIYLKAYNQRLWIEETRALHAATISSLLPNYRGPVSCRCLISIYQYCVACA
jgi:hypothetical protein